MMLFRKLYQSLLIYSYKEAHLLSKQLATGRKLVPIDILITKNPDVYEKITGELPTIDWKSIREKIIQDNELITSATVDSTIIDMCFKNSHIDNALAYFKFLKENDYPLNIAIIRKYFKLFVLKHDRLTDADKREIVEIYNMLRQKHSYLDNFTAEQCICSLCLTDEWEKSYEIIEMMKTVSTPGVTVYSALASAAFRNGKSDVAWQALSNIVQRNLIPQDYVYKSHLQYCQSEDAETFNSRMEDMFNFWAEHNIVPDSKVIDTYIEVANKYSWNTKLVSILKKRGHCQHCDNFFSKVTFSEKDFEELAKRIMDRVIIGSDIYCRTNPKELLKFQKFINDTKPYDIVIDGLNITYVIKNKMGPQISRLIDVIDYFRQQKKKILVLTRKHQRMLSSFKQVERHASVFLTDDLSSDDPYLLYATMASGINAKFVSRDLMRQHKYALQDKHLEQVFKKWQYSHQYLVKISKTGIRIQEPFDYIPNIQKNNDCWHLPCINKDVFEQYTFPYKWYCFKYNKKK